MTITVKPLNGEVARILFHDFQISWILFPEEKFCPIRFYEYTRYLPTDEDVKLVAESIRSLKEDEALSVWYK